MRLAKKYKSGAPVLKPANELPPVSWIPTGILAMDWINGGGGPRRKTEQLVGGKSVGKSTLVLRRIAEAQRNGVVCALVDIEHSLDKVWAKKQGVDLENLVVYTPEDYDSGEAILDVVIDILKLGDIGLVALDSVTALCPAATISGSMEDKHYAGTAAILGQFFSKIIGPGILYNSEANLLLVNQPRDVIGARFHMDRLPGGKALEHYSDIITWVKDGDFIFADSSKDAPKIGKEVRLINYKNKVRHPYRSSTVNLYFDSGFNPLMDVILFAQKYNLIEMSGSWGYYNGESIGQGINQHAQWLIQHKDVYVALKTQIRELILGGK
jgi:recombination protein RecA